jgi:integrase
MLATDITVQMVEDWAQAWAADLMERGKSKHLVNHALRLLQATWNKPWGSARRPPELPLNPFAQVDRFSVEKVAKYLPTDSQVAAILMAAHPEERLILELMAGTGARPMEGVALSWEDVRAEAEPFSVLLWTRKKKGGHRTSRRVPMTLELATRFRSWRKRHPESVFVFQRTDGEGPQHRTYWWLRQLQERLCLAAEVPYFPPHSWRHLYASRLARAGESLPNIQALLGHENATTTNRYLHEIVGLPLQSG